MRQPLLEPLIAIVLFSFCALLVCVGGGLAMAGETGGIVGYMVALVCALAFAAWIGHEPNRASM